MECWRGPRTRQRIGQDSRARDRTVPEPGGEDSFYRSDSQTNWIGDRRGVGSGWQHGLCGAAEVILTTLTE